MIRAKLKLSLVIFLSVTGLSSCVTPTSVEQNMARIDRIKPILASEAAFRRFISNTTTQAYSNQHGTQIEYVAADGRTFLAYPGNSDILIGRWKVITNKQDNYMQMCFQYGDNTYNPVTNIVGGGWECDGASSYLFNMDEIYDGDLLDMANAHDLPKKLSKYFNVSVASAVNATGKGPLNAPNKATFK